MKKLLFITAIPPGNKGGGELVTLKTIESLSNKYIIDLIYFTYPNHNSLADSYVNKSLSFKPSYKNCLNKIFYFPLFTRRFSTEIYNYLKSISTNYDVLFFDYSQTAIYSLFIQHPYKIIRCHDVILQKYFRKCPIVIPWVYYTERHVLKSARKVFCLVEKDSMLLKKYYNIEAIHTSDVLSLAKQDFNLPYVVNDKFVFFGYWARPENTKGLIWFIKNVFPKLKGDIKMKLVVMGGGLNQYYKNKFLDKNGIKYLGFVEDCYSVLREAKCVIVPLFQGAGVKIKVLDAFSCGTPVIGTEIAFEGIANIDGLTYKCKDKKDFINTINNFQQITFDDKLQYKKLYENIANGKEIIDYILEDN